MLRAHRVVDAPIRHQRRAYQPVEAAVVERQRADRHLEACLACKLGGERPARRCLLPTQLLEDESLSLGMEDRARMAVAYMQTFFRFRV